MGFYLDKDFTYHPEAGGGGSANAVLAAAVLADNALVRGDGGVRGVQDSGWLLDDSDILTAAGNLNMGANSITGTRGWILDLSGDGGGGENIFSSGDHKIEVQTNSQKVLTINDEKFIFYSRALNIRDNIELEFGNAADTVMGFSLAQDPDSFLFGVDGVSRYMLICDKADLTALYDFGHSAQSHPTLFIHSANQSTTEWMGLSYEGLDVGGASLSVKVTGAEALRVEDEATLGAGETSLWLYDDDNGQMEQVTVGAADSGGSGYKLLRISN
jgi:hypothetical protein